MNAMFLQRIGYFFYKRKVPILPKLLSSLNYILFHCYLPSSIEIGKGTKLGYGGLGIVIHNRAIIGQDVVIAQNVTIGGRSKNYEVPKIGNRVYIGAGAKLLGPINIGDDVSIGANAVVIKDIPSGATAVGVPAKVIRSNA
ncbi:serine O-acetyltransferase [Cobetia sp. 14N.309.X.WAT.E.A4]|uniref:serine O-acetyltransferase n=1 Tax=Cobetia sp. 14N.309.X.WAT.E.A4 TaxID=2998323 RepID=UPI0025B129A8|nr:serine O-acetyltransferase [Cobetia sp. 14N.309.X.WAT.E.A4]MDN2658003.1 serine O-acetyltransferase [Cobetia sp. 14N.309.X.WAT.E.A4]